MGVRARRRLLRPASVHFASEMSCWFRFEARLVNKFREQDVDVIGGLCDSTHRGEIELETG